MGQKAAIANVRRAVHAALDRGETPPHILLCGPPGLGKTSLAKAAAVEIGAACRIVHAPELREDDDLAEPLSALEGGGILFIDEIHRLPRRVAESLYRVMDAHQITVVGATTDEDEVPPPLRTRFQVCADLEHYDDDDLVEIQKREAGQMEIDLDDDAARVLAGAAQQTPRTAIFLLRTARDEAQLQGHGSIDVEIATTTLESLRIDRNGYTRLQGEYLSILAASDRPLGLGTLADRLGKSRGAVATVIEPFLMRQGLVARSRFGRVLQRRR